MKYGLLRAAIKSKDLQKPHILKDCDLVIDGRTYFRRMYKNSGCQFTIGGEYDRFASYVRNQLKTFVDCNVTCYVIFNGGMKADIDRRKEIHQGIIDKTDAILSFTDDKDYCEPIFVKDVCKEVLSEARIKFFVAEYDNREALLNVAKKLRCPVLTSSYEYCLYGVSCITPKSLSYDEGHQSISCRIFRVQDCRGTFRLRFDLVPIFLTLMDEDGDYIKRLPEIKTRRTNKIAMSVHFWIKRQTPKNAFKAIERNLKDETQKKVFTYAYVDNLNVLAFSHNSLAIRFFGITRNVKGDDKMAFENAVANGTVAIPYINLKNNSTFSGSWLIVDKNEEDAMLPAMDIVKYVYASLVESNKGKIIFIGRKSGKSDVWEIEWNYFEPALKDLWNKNPVKKHVIKKPKEDISFEKFLENTLPGFKLENLQSIPEGSWMIMITLIYYSLKRGVDMRLVSSMLMSYVMVGPVSERIGVIRRSTFVGLNIIDDDNMQELSNKDCEAAAKKLVNLFDANNLKSNFDRKILHTLAEFQHCLQHMNYLNKLCGEKIHCTVYHKALNILFVYNAYIKISENVNRHLMRYFEKCLGKSSSVLKHFHELRRVFHDCFSSVEK